MTVDILFQFANSFILVRVDGTNIIFSNSDYGMKATTIEGLNISKQGVEREHPDLIGNPEWKKIGVQRFKDKIKTFNTEEDRAKYIIDDLKKYGYQPKFKQKTGFRRVKIE